MDKKRIYSISGLKVIAIWLIFWWHSWMQNPPCDLGARGCEFFFVASGFLICYSRGGGVDQTCSWGGSVRYVIKKLSGVWPLHLACFLLCLLSMAPTDIFRWQTALKALLNLLLLHSWSHIEGIFFSFNGPSWFLSCLLFCWFCTPVLLRLILKKGKIWILFPAVFLIRYGIEEIQFFYPDTFWNFNIHCSPLLRVMEFFMGMMTAAVWSEMAERMRKWRSGHELQSMAGFSLCEAGILFLTGYLFVAKQNSWGRAVFVLYFCIVMFVFAFDGGICSRLFAWKPVTWLAGIQLEFFMFHVPVINFMTKYVQPCGLSAVWLTGLTFVTVLLLALGWNRFLKKPSERLATRGFKAVWNWLVS